MNEHKNWCSFLVFIVDITCAVVVIISGDGEGFHGHVHVGVDTGLAHASVGLHHTVVELILLGTDGTLLSGVQVVGPRPRRLQLL